MIREQGDSRRNRKGEGKIEWLLGSRAIEDFLPLSRPGETDGKIGIGWIGCSGLAVSVNSSDWPSEVGWEEALLS